MIKTITKVGNSQGIIFDAAIMEMARLKTGDQLNMELHSGGVITLTPIQSKPKPEDVSRSIKSTMKDYKRTMRRLA